MKDLIISSTTRYTKRELHNYVESINKCGFTGDKIMVVFDVTSETIEYLKTNGWEVYQSQLHGHIQIGRASCRERV